MLEEYGGTPHLEHVDPIDPEQPVQDEQQWRALEQEGVAQGFIEDIQGLLDGK